VRFRNTLIEMASIGSMAVARDDISVGCLSSLGCKLGHCAVAAKCEEFLVRNRVLIPHHDLEVGCVATKEEFTRGVRSLLYNNA
jgi:hypothetical protein